MNIVQAVSESMGMDKEDAIQELALIKLLYSTGEFDAEELLERVNLTEKYVNDFMKYCK